MPNALLIPNGSYGDVHPYMALGGELVRRGWEVKIHTVESFREQAEKEGMEFDLRDAPKDYLSRMWVPDKNNPEQTLARKKARLNKRIEETLAYTLANAPDGTVVIAPVWEMGARIARDAMPIKLVTPHLQPLILRSVHDCPVMPPWMPGAGRRALMGGIDLFIDYLFKRTINACRARLGLDKIRRVGARWWHSPDLVLAMFPDWLGAPQPDWPDNTVQTGFPLYVRDAQGTLDAELDRFLTGTTPTIAFARSSAVAEDPAFFEASIDAARQLGRQALLLTPKDKQVPVTLPDGVMHRSYASYRRVLPRCEAFVHNGGIGALAEGLLAGRPQVIADVCNDQGDNGLRLERLGVGRRLPAARATGKRLADLLVSLRTESTRSACERYAQLAAGDCLQISADAVERLAETPSARSNSMPATVS